MNIYDFTVKDNEGKSISLEEYRGKVLLIVNTATECGFTPQYDDIQDLYERYNEDGFEVLDFPCNQFGNQAPGTAEEIHLFCSQRFGTTFPTFEKVEVNGENEEPLFGYLKSQKGFEGFNPEHPSTEAMIQLLSKMKPNFATSNDIKWNFTKFLVDQDGNVVERFESAEFPETIENAVSELL